jgi:hypothetical protein
MELDMASLGIELVVGEDWAGSCIICPTIE